MRKTLSATVALGLLAGMTGIAQADDINADVDADAVATPHGNGLNANQEAGTTVEYGLSALIRNSQNNNDDVFPATGPAQTVTVDIARSGAWLNTSNGGSPAAMTFSTYNASQSGIIRISVPASATGSQTMSAVLTATASNGKSVNGVTLRWTITATTATPADPCATASAPAAPTFSSTPAAEDGTAGSGWFKTVPTVSASTTTSGATISYATEVAGSKSAYSNTAPVLGQGETIVFAKATSATCNLTSESTRTFKVDSVSPTISGADVNNTTWRNTALSASFTASDTPGSGLATASDAAFTLTASLESASATTPTTVSKTVYDVAGNSSTRTLSALIDRTKPTDLAFVGGNVANGDSFYYGADRTLPTSCTANDALSGLAGCVLSYGGATGPTGAKTVIATATDDAGNVETLTLGYTILAWTLNGFYQPVDMTTGSTTVWNTVKNGSSVPLKFEVFAGAAELTNPAVVGSLTMVSQAQVSCTATGTEDLIEELGTSGNSVLRYDATAGQLVFNWQTPKKAGACYKVTMTTQDGSSLSAFFKLK